MEPSLRNAIVSAAALALFAAAPACSKDDGAPAGDQPTETAEPAEPATAEPERPSGPSGSIQGRVTLSGDAPEMPTLQRGADPVCAEKEMKAETILVGDDGGLANVVVRVLPGTVDGWVPKEPVVVDQVDCMYRPRVQGAVRGQTLQVANSDPTMHNVHARTLEKGKRQGTETIVNRAQPAGIPPIQIPIEDQDVVKLKCDSHGWMAAYVVVSDNPYFAVSGDDGRFTLEGVPVGEHQVEAWHEFFGVKSGTVTVAEDGAATIDFGYDVKADDPTATAAATE